MQRLAVTAVLGVAVVSLAAPGRLVEQERGP